MPVVLQSPFFIACFHSLVLLYFLGSGFRLHHHHHPRILFFLRLLLLLLLGSILRLRLLVCAAYIVSITCFKVFLLFLSYSFQSMTSFSVSLLHRTSLQWDSVRWDCSTTWWRNAKNDGCIRNRFHWLFVFSCCRFQQCRLRWFSLSCDQLLLDSLCDVFLWLLLLFCCFLTLQVISVSMSYRKLLRFACVCLLSDITFVLSSLWLLLISWIV